MGLEHRHVALVELRLDVLRSVRGRMAALVWVNRTAAGIVRRKACSCTRSSRIAFTASVASSIDPLVGMMTRSARLMREADHHRGRALEVDDHEGGLAAAVFDLRR